MTGAELLAVPAGHSGGNSSPVWLWVAGPIVIVIGLVFFAKPRLQWQMNRWRYKDKDALEPSAKGLAMARVSAAGMVIVGIVFVVIAASK